MLSPKYAFISACLKGEEPKTVTSEHVDKMMTAPNLQDALATIRETDIGSHLEELPVKTFDYLDECLWGYLAQRIRYVESFKFLPKEIPKVSRAYVAKYDVSNIKAALQGISGVKKLLEADKEFSGKIVEVRESDCLGGVIAEDVEGKLRIDNTYEIRLEMLLPKLLPKISKELFEAP